MGYRWQCVEHGEIIRLLVSPRSPPGLPQDLVLLMCKRLL